MTGTFEQQLAAYDFDLPQALIARNPPARRGDSRLLTLSRRTGEAGLSRISDLAAHLPPHSLLVFNDARVTPARLLGRREPAPGRPGGAAEALLLDLPPAEAPAGEYQVWCLARPGRRLKTGDWLTFGEPDGQRRLTARIVEKDAEGRVKINFRFPAPPHQVLAEIGHMPLPPYIGRPDTAEDRSRYQTVYARTAGAVAAPTAGLHFTEKLLAGLVSAGHELAWVTLRVGLGTFAPLTWEQWRGGKLHREIASLPEAASQALIRAKREKRAVVAVGTTSARTIEWAALAGGGSPLPAAGPCDLFIRPGHHFYLDGLLTNFHLPKSSLFILVAALAGLPALRAAYQKAICEKFRFYSYGDAMLII